MVPIGIWDDVSVEVLEAVWLEDLWVRAESGPITGAKAKSATVTVAAQVAGAIPAGEPAELICEIRDPAGQPIATSALHLSAGTASGRVTLKHPALWWPNGYGPSPLYTACLTLRAGGAELGRREVRFGVRSLRWERNEGGDPASHPLTLVVNDRRIFLRGSNWVPADALPGRLRPKHYRMLIDRARDMNLNLLRMWGGGLFEKEAFYDFCDEAGMLVWQEFPMACANYPKDPEFVAEMVAEAEHAVRRLRNHPCICLWCGGNENDYYGEVPDSPTLLAIGEVVNRLHPGVDYHVSCPDKSRPGERGHGPWTYQEHAGWNQHFRELASEIGCIALPSERTLERIAPNEPWPNGPSFAYHFASTFRHLLWSPGEKYGGVMPFAPATRAEWVLFSQFIQAEQLAYMTGHYRSLAWRASGLFGWQFNTPWPEGCFSVLDWDGTPKMAWYWLRAAQAPVSCFCEDEGMDLSGKDGLALKPFVFDSTLKHPGRCESVLALWSADRELWSDRQEVRLDGPECVAPDPVRIPLPEGFTGPLVLRHEIRKGRRILARMEKLFYRGNARTCFDQLAVIHNARRLRNDTGRVAFVAIPPGRGAPRPENFFFLLPGECAGQEAGGRGQESGVRSQEAGVRRQESGGRGTG
jgi:beta-mannosidase